MIQTVKRMKIQSTDWEKIFVKHISDEWVNEIKPHVIKMDIYMKKMKSS